MPLPFYKSKYTGKQVDDKLDIIVVTGAGTRVLSDDGSYIDLAPIAGIRSLNNYSEDSITLTSTLTPLSLNSDHGVLVNGKTPAVLTAGKLDMANIPISPTGCLTVTGELSVNVDGTTVQRNTQNQLTVLPASAPLTGYTLTPVRGIIQSSDTVAQAFSKLENFDTDILEVTAADGETRMFLAGTTFSATPAVADIAFPLTGTTASPLTIPVNAPVTLRSTDTALLRSLWTNLMLNCVYTLTAVYKDTASNTVFGTNTAVFKASATSAVVDIVFPIEMSGLVRSSSGVVVDVRISKEANATDHTVNLSSTATLQTQLIWNAVSRMDNTVLTYTGTELSDQLQVNSNIAAELLTKQDIVDPTLMTNAKTVPGGINELLANGTGLGWTAGKYAPEVTNAVVDPLLGSYVSYLGDPIDRILFTDYVMDLKAVYLTIVSGSKTRTGNMVLEFFVSEVSVARSVVPVTLNQAPYTQTFNTPVSGRFRIQRMYTDVEDTLKDGGPVTVIVTAIRNIETPPTIGSLDVPVIFETATDATYGDVVYLNGTSRYITFSTRSINLREFRLLTVSASSTVSGNIVLKAFVDNVAQGSFVVPVGLTMATTTLEIPGYTGSVYWYRDIGDSRDTLKDTNSDPITAIVIAARTVEV